MSNGSEPHGSEGPVIVATFYRFVPLSGLATLKARLCHHARRLDLRGTILLAPEGINGTLSAPRAELDSFLAGLRAELPFAGLAVRETRDDAHPFGRFKVRLKREIVSLGVPGVDPRRRTGEHVPPAAWNALLARPGLKVVDARNRYEVHLGTFQGAIDPGTESFRDLPAWFDAHLDPERDGEVAMFCTGGIRCEKAAAHLLERGFERVYQLDGGILAYLAEIHPSESRWRGECFVFDERVTLDHRLAAVPRELCPNCRIPILPGEKARPEYEPNVSCRHCHHRTDDRRREALGERRRQAALARERGGPA